MNCCDICELRKTNQLHPVTITIILPTKTINEDLKVCKNCMSFFNVNSMIIGIKECLRFSRKTYQ